MAKSRGVYKGRKAKLTSDQAEELRTRLASGESVSKLAADYGVSRQSVYNYRTTHRDEIKA